MSRRRPDAFDALGAVTILTAAVLGWVALTTKPPIVDQLLQARTTAVVLGPAPITVPIPGVGR